MTPEDWERLRAWCRGQHMALPQDPSLDCSEVAERARAAFPGGTLWTARPAPGLTLRVSEFGQLVEGYEYHVVYVWQGVAIDPRMSPEPEPWDAYRQHMSVWNPAGVQWREGTA